MQEYLMGFRTNALRVNCQAVINSAQCRAARALLGMTQTELAAEAGISVIAIKRFERSGSDPRLSTVNAIERALVNAGVALIDDGAASPAGEGPGVRLTRLRNGDRC